eukprot:scaffold209781_cov20-Tisochrysis_lutea.AAC.1
MDALPQHCNSWPDESVLQAAANANQAVAVPSELDGPARVLSRALENGPCLAPPAVLTHLLMKTGP